MTGDPDNAYWGLTPEVQCEYCVSLTFKDPSFVLNYGSFISIEEAERYCALVKEACPNFESFSVKRCVDC